VVVLGWSTNCQSYSDVRGYSAPRKETEKHTSIFPYETENFIIAINEPF